MNPYDRPADNVKVVLLADLPYSFKEQHGSHAVLHIEGAGDGVLVVRVRHPPTDSRAPADTAASRERVLTVADGQEIPLMVEAILAASTVEVDGYEAETATDVAQVRAYLWE